jgi:hypothetical protein
MRFISMHKATPDMEAGAPPSPRVMEGMGPLMGELIQSGVFIAGEGLRPSALGVRLTFSGGTRTITPGPLHGNRGPIDRYLIVRVASIDDAIEWATRFAGDADTEIDVRPVTEPWDLGMFPKPPDVQTTRYMIMRKSDESRPTDDAADVARLTSTMSAAGVLLSAESIRPSGEGIRLLFRSGNRTITDGPFTESKELIAGFSILDLGSRDEAVAWAAKFAALFDELEIDIRPLVPG